MFLMSFSNFERGGLPSGLNASDAGKCRPDVVSATPDEAELPNAAANRAQPPRVVRIPTKYHLRAHPFGRGSMGKHRRTAMYAGGTASAGQPRGKPQTRSVVVSPGPSRPVVALPSRIVRLDTHGPSVIDRRDGSVRVGPEMSATPRAELRSILDHADRDTFDVRNLGAAKTKRVAAACLLLLRSIGMACR